MRFHRSTAVLLGLPWLLTLVFFWGFPLIYSFFIGFTDQTLLRPDYQWVGWENYRRLFADEIFLSALKNTLIFVLVTIPITTVISLILALLVHRQFPGRGLFRAGLFLPSITSLVVISLIFTNLFSRGGYIAALASLAGFTPPEYGFLYDADTALYAVMGMDVWMSVGYYMLIFLAGLQSIPDELHEAAVIDGASGMRRLFSITLPMLRPVALFILVINSIKSFQIFVEIFVMTKGKFDTMSLVYFIYDTGLTTHFEFGYASAAAYLLFGLIGLFSLAQFFLLRKKSPTW